MSFSEVESACEIESKMEAPKYHLDREMMKAQKLAVKKDWKKFKELFELDRNKGKLLEAFDLFGNTALHAVALSGTPQLLQELLEKLNENVRQNALEQPNVEGNTLLHEAVFNDEPHDMVDVIMGFDPLWQLLEVTNESGETPVFRAARFGKLKILQHIHRKRTLESKHFQLSEKQHQTSESDQKPYPILHACVLGFHFDVAIWLMKKVDEKLAEEKYAVNDKVELTSLQLLSKMRMAFKSTATIEMGTREDLIYKLLPEKGYETELELDDDGNTWFKSSRDIESGQSDDENENSPKSIFSSWLNYVVWKHLEKDFGCIDKIWEQKKRHKLAEHLAKLLVKKDESWSYSHNDVQPQVVLPDDFPSNVTEKRKEIELEKEKIKLKQSQQEKKPWQTPLFLAAASGIIEVVKMIIVWYPEAISHVNEDGLNILHIAVRHRQLEIYEFIERSPAFKSLQARITKNDKQSDRTILHQAASMEYYREQVLPGVAYQLQDELIWYHRVKQIVPEHYLMHRDVNDLTAGDLLDIEHAEMHDQAKQWMKETAQSCSTVAVLIAGVVFAAAYAIPGGNEGGRPILHKSSAFRVFTIMDVVSLAGSLGSVVMFLSILTSSFDLWDFHKSLPRKLKVGFIMLFFSLICTMLAFAATILLTIRMEGDKKKTTFTYSLAFVIVSIFGLTQFPLYKLFQDQTKLVKRQLSKWWERWEKCWEKESQNL